MLTDNQTKGRKLHTRNIEVFTYEYDDKNMVAEGMFKEDILIPIYVSGQKRQPCTVHHMGIQLRIECSSLTITEIKVQMPGIPYDECMETTDSLDAIKGLKIAPGFTSKVKKILGESKRCLHLITLLLAMAPAVIQSYKVFINKNPGSNGVPIDLMEDYLVDSCWVWRKEGHLADHLKQKIKY